MWTEDATKECFHSASGWVHRDANKSLFDPTINSLTLLQSRLEQEQKKEIIVFFIGIVDVVAKGRNFCLTDDRAKSLTTCRNKSLKIQLFAVQNSVPIHHQQQYRQQQ